MTAPKTPKALLLLLILALAAAVVVSGCGGGGSSTSGSTAEESTPPAAEEEGTEEAEEEPAEEGGAGGGESAAGGEGKTIFTSNCASCHVLKAAGANGEVGPNLDELMPDEKTVEKQVITGGGPMPAFGRKEILTPEEVTTVSEYVAAEAGE
jgi:mono/diheme cytochrome c family protein